MMTKISGRKPGRIAAMIALAMLPLVACDPDSLLESETPSLLDADKLGDPSQAQLLMNGVAADFECAHGAFVAANALMSDELEDAQLGAAPWSYDRRSWSAEPGGTYGTASCNAQIFGVYRPLSTARWTADNLLRHLQDVWTDEQVPARQQLMARAAVYAGFSLTELGMIMCSAALDGGPEMTSAQLLGAAEDRFTRAMTAADAAGAADLRYAALAGRARVRLYLGDDAGAATDAAAVPPDFVFNATASDDASSSRRWNRIFHFVNFSRFHMIAEESRDLTTGGVPDPRVVAVETESRTIDGRLSVAQQKYGSLGAPLPVTRYEEAQLILAEAQGGQTAIDVINALRARHSLPQLTAQEIADLENALIEERRRELFLEGQRFNDIVRFGLPLVPAPGTPFPKGGFYGSTSCLPLPDVERFNNPNIS